ncbi:heparinase II/III family protein [Methylopila sp. M107]|uniref:heparinase II/III family protein n=1 Tax=Methylopila sp. M107 TaxID=1101190 RepID=UPI0003636A75|nr:heparinase II/III family protein [Methylopila sp. M107]
MGAFGENLRLAARVVAHGARTSGRRLLASAAVRPPGRGPEKLLIAPQDLRTSDPTIAADIYAGRYAFAGRTVSTGGASPFLAAAPSQDWAAELHGFGWLRHLEAAGTTLAQANARALVEEWISLRGGPDPVARQPEVAARRLMSWLSHSPLVLTAADRQFHRRFLKTIARETRLLARAANTAPDGAPKLTAAAALAFAGLTLAGEARLQRASSKALAEEIDRQILPDGGHASRNPGDLVELLVDLIPLRLAYAARNLPPPQPLITAIDRMTPMLRFFRHGDGDFAHFNGAGATSADLLAAVLAHDDARGLPLDDAAHSGYQRIAAGDAVVLVDAGPPPPFPLSANAHAGCLSFEYSSGPDRIVVNCGAPRFGREDWERAARATAAHSTATINDESSCRFTSGGVRRLVGARIMAGPTDVPVARKREARGVTLTASHDGYAARFGVVHERMLTLAPNGETLSGEDLFRGPEGGAPHVGEQQIAVRFHLHPAIKASVTQDGRGAVLALADGTGWTFGSADAAVTLEESVFLSGALGPRRSEQIVIRATLRAALRLAWSFERMPADASRRRTPSVAQFAPLPL